LNGTSKTDLHNPTQDSTDLSCVIPHSPFVVAASHAAFRKTPGDGFATSGEAGVIANTGHFPLLSLSCEWCFWKRQHEMLQLQPQAAKVAAATIRKNRSNRVESL
jgi:hypothetical protein